MATTGSTNVVDRVSQESPREQHAPTTTEKVAVVEVDRFDTSDDVTDSSEDDERRQTKSTRTDLENMRRMGKPQQLVRHFRLLSVASFVALATAAWELGLFLITPALAGGGRSMLVWSLLWNFVGFLPIYLSMAEMASMAPIAGSQYHWVSEFAPENCQRVLSYITGWTSTLAWQAGNAIGVFLVGTLIQSIIQINIPDYAFPAWHATLLVIAAVVIAYVGNVFGAKVLPHWQNAVFAIHVLAYFAVIVPIWVTAPKVSSKEVWFTFTNDAGWPTLAMAILTGQLTGISNQVGVDCAAHMSEEVKDAATAVPKAMMAIYFINFIIIFPAAVTIAYHLDNVTSSLDPSIEPTTYPAIYVLRHAMSPGWLSALLAVTVFILVAGNISYLAAVTRDLFAFARDQGFPFSNWVSKVSEKRHIPENACLLTSIVAICLSLIYLGSPVAFYAITSLCTVCLLQTYCTSICCVLWRRIYYPETLPYAAFSLGKWGVPVNAIAAIYAAWSFFWLFWPTWYPVEAETFNWASVLFVATLLFACGDFIIRGRFKYVGPVALVEGRKVQ